MFESNSSKLLFVYTIVEGKEKDKNFFVKVGVAFVNKDRSINVKLDAFPVNGQLHIREQQERDNDARIDFPTRDNTGARTSAYKGSR